jgi:long-chain acyl-CoA synthetase
MQERIWHRHYSPGVPPSIPYEELRVTELLQRSAARFPERTALVFLHARLGYAALWAEVERLAGALARLGAGPGTSVAIQLPNLPQTVIAYYAALQAGARVVLTTPLYTPREIEHQWHDAECRIAVTADFLFQARVAPIRARLPVEHYVIASIQEYLPWPIRPLAAAKLRRRRMTARVAETDTVHAFRRLARRSEPLSDAPRVGWHEPAVLQYTGGTTGVSKAAVLTHANVSINAQQVVETFVGCEAGREVVLTALPLFHVFGMTVCMNFATALGATMVLVPNPRDVGALVTSIAKHRATIFPGVPAMYNALNNHPGVENADLRSVKACLSGSAPIPVDVLERFERLTGARIVEGFGLSETSPVTHVNPLVGTRKVGTVGVPISDTDARVVDADDSTRALAPGEQGELVIRGPQVMQGYWRRPDETALVLRDGWLLTGDLATMDEDGYFRIVGRK